jgi:mannose-6-phosphate isomerase-like protein (cupin superfamily)
MILSITLRRRALTGTMPRYAHDFIPTTSGPSLQAHHFGVGHSRLPLLHLRAARRSFLDCSGGLVARDNGGRRWAGSRLGHPPKRPEGYKPPPGVTFESGGRELSDKLPGMGDHFDRSAPGMHTTDTIDYGVVVRGEMTLELDDGQKVHLRQGDCIVQNGSRHRWRNPLPERCLMAFVSVGGKRG